MGLIAGIGRRALRRSRWLAERLWLIAAAEVAFVSYRHLRRLEPQERSRLIELARKSKGRPSKHLSAAERREAEALLDKLGHIELAGSVAETVLPFRPLSRLATRLVARRQRPKSPEQQAEVPDREVAEREPSPV